MMQLLINGEPITLQESTTLSHLLAKLGYEQNAIAVALNGTFIPRHQYETCIVENAQALEIVSPMQGG